LLMRCAKRVLLKLSPLFDVAEAWRLFPTASEVTVVAANGECKEVLVDFSPETPAQQTLRVVLAAHQDQGAGHAWTFPAEAPAEPAARPIPEPPRYVLEPSVAFYKARAAARLFAAYFPALSVGFQHTEGYFFADVLPAHFPGRVFEVLEMHPYKPSAIGKFLKAKGIKRANIAKRHFPLSVAEVRKQLGLAEGGEDFLLCTETANGKCVIWAKASK